MDQEPHIHSAGASAFADLSRVLAGVSDRSQPASWFSPGKFGSALPPGAAAQQLQEQQVRMVDQARQVQSGLEKLVRGLVDLSKTDDAAKKLVTKFGIKVE